MEIHRILFRTYSHDFPHPPRTYIPEPPEPPDHADVTAAIFRHKLEIGDKHALGCLYDDVIRDLELGTPVSPDTLLLLLRGLKRPKYLPRQTDYREVFNDIYARMVFKVLDSDEEKQLGTKSFYEAAKNYHEWLRKQNLNKLNTVQRAIRAKPFEEAFAQLRKEWRKYI